jgi:hypothetical protein
MTKHNPKLVGKPQWWKHLRNYWGRVFWKRDRKAQRKECRE